MFSFDFEYKKAVISKLFFLFQTLSYITLPWTNLLEILLEMALFFKIPKKFTFFSSSTKRTKNLKLEKALQL